MTASRSARLLRLAPGVLAAIVAGVLGYLIGNQHPPVVTTRTGVAYASSAQAGVQSAGFTYDVPLDVPWIDSQGIIHQGTRPPCLPAYKHSRIVFGSVDVAAIGSRTVVWVRC